uniref:CG32712 n=3 Tax=Drosophila melanogaster TaxID=7227 RepID=Q8IRN4_DROME|eukprot:NP_727262.2 uncharacterized protein Dmel_CG32712 [Drosophila melanogaster]
MWKSLGLGCGLLSLGAFISCFVALHMLNQIIHIELDASVDVTMQLEADKDLDVRCHGTLIVGNPDAAHLSRQELSYLRWTVVFTLLYSFATTLLIRAKYLGNFEISLATSNAMMLMGSLLSVLLVMVTVALHQHEPFPDLRCNQLVVYHLYYIALNTAISVVFFLVHSIQELLLHRLQPTLKY